MNLIFWKAMPFSDWMGKPLLMTFFAGFGIPAAILLLAAIRLSRKEGNFLLGERLRLNLWNRKFAVWSLGLAVLLISTNWLLSGSVLWLQENLISAPKFWMRVIDVDPNFFMDTPLQGNVWLPVCLAIFILFNVFCQEVWWRGYILPRQELVSGNATWIIHGLLWCLFESYMVWNFPRNLVTGLALAYVCQRTRSTWPSIVARFAIHIPLLARIIQGVSTPASS